VRIRSVALVLVVALASACASAEVGAVAVPTTGTLAAPPGAQQAVVVRHTDGDTFWLRGVGVGPVPAARTKVRLLEVDTPEVFGTPGCYGKEASARTAQLLPLGAHVRVEADRELRDRYGRLLLYVWTPAGVSLEESLLQDGYARTLLVRPNDRHIAQLRAIEATARLARRGLWSACTG
jgi:micrococcal nuclease